MLNPLPLGLSIQGKVSFNSIILASVIEWVATALGPLRSQRRYTGYIDARGKDILEYMPKLVAIGSPITLQETIIH
jgi:hypothetical protein